VDALSLSLCLVVPSHVLQYALAIITMTVLASVVWAKPSPEELRHSAEEGL